jgi:hypothetical protein
MRLTHTASWQRARILAQATANRPEPPRAPLPDVRQPPPENWQAERRAEQAARWVRRPTQGPRRPGDAT